MCVMFRGQRCDFSCHCHRLEKTRTLTWHSSGQGCSEGSGSFALEINILPCWDVGALLRVQTIPRSWDKKLHCCRDCLTFSVSLQISVWQMHTKNSPLQAAGNFIFCLPLLAPGPTVRVWNVKYISRWNREKGRLLMKTSAAVNAGPRTKVTGYAFNNTFSFLAAVASPYILLPRSGLQ